MVKKFLVLAGFAAFLLTTSCNLGDLLTVKADANIDVNLPVEVNGTDMKTGPYDFSATKTVDLSKEDALVDYINNIKTIELTELLSTINGLTDGIVLLNANLTLTGAGTTATWTFNSLTINNGTALILANNNGQLAAISTMLTALGEVTVTFSGQSDTNNVAFTLENRLKAAITAGLGG